MQASLFLGPYDLAIPTLTKVSLIDRGMCGAISKAQWQNHSVDP